MSALQGCKELSKQIRGPTGSTECPYRKIIFGQFRSLLDKSEAFPGEISVFSMICLKADSGSKKNNMEPSVGRIKNLCNMDGVRKRFYFLPAPHTQLETDYNFVFTIGEEF